MQVVTCDAELELKKYIDSISYNLELWECAHIAFSKLEEFFIKKHVNVHEALLDHKAVTMQLVSTALLPQLKDQEGNIFICFDNDIFALFKPKDHQILAKIEGFSREFFERDIKDIFSVYNLGKKAVDLDFLLRKKQKEAAIHALEKENKTRKFNLFNENIDVKKFERELEHRTYRVKDRILVVDDDELYTTMLKNSLQNDFQVITASSGKEGILKYIEQTPDVLILDIHLQDMDGVEILEQILSVDKDAYVLMLSADSVSSNILRTKEIGAKGFITKPFSKEKISQAIKGCPTISAKKLTGK